MLQRKGGIQAMRRGGTTNRVLITAQPSTVSKVSKKESIEPTIRKSFPESWIFDAFDNNQGYFDNLYFRVENDGSKMAQSIIVLMFRF